MSGRMNEADLLLMRAGKAVHAVFWHDENGDCDNPYECGASVQEEAAAAAVIALIEASRPTLEPEFKRGPNAAVRAKVGPACGCLDGSCNQVGAPGCYFGEIKR